MTSKKQRMIIYGVAVQLLLIAMVCYAAFPVKKPDVPIRLMYQTKAGKVLFDHKTHTDSTGYGLACEDCHHPHPRNEEEEDADADTDQANADEAEFLACSDCHFRIKKKKAENDGMTGFFHLGPLPEPEEGAEESAESEAPEAPAYPESCLDCHDESEYAEWDDEQFPKRSVDAIHRQCMECHDQYEKGPGSSSDDCTKCHVQ